MGSLPNSACGHPSPGPSVRREKLRPIRGVHMRRIPIGRFLAASVTIAASLVFALPAHGAGALCGRPVELVVFRGSCENADEPGKTGWEGPRLHQILEAGRAMATSDGVNLAHAPVFAVPGPDYPAIKLSDYLSLTHVDLGKLMESAGQGTSA